ncbi:MAG TPA: pyridoxamine 5'-phosphate oxidase family protein [Acidimicrobiales bacterium]|jgi:nitroimidazol reductase NimA-like FMN-containing flavoprotein (pyridoxamine 5'-phosphate oxidase superfamily)|nr:pyridoxamine 5'-phosphate oxidase family protein [Acidimicrobiales bacterium]
MLVDGGLELLDEDEAWALLRAGVVGRVGVTIGAMPAIFPVNYAVIDDAVVFRTAPGSKLSAAASDAVVAFEVDDYDRADRSGWSVLAVGRSEVVHDLDVTRKVLAAGLEPYADGSRTSIVRIRPVFVSGRRIVREAPRAEP